MIDPSEQAKHFVDFASVATAIGTIVQALPSVAALFTIVWTVIRIWETDTVQRIFSRKNHEQG